MRPLSTSPTKQQYYRFRFTRVKETKETPEAYLRFLRDGKCVWQPFGPDGDVAVVVVTYFGSVGHPESAGIKRHVVGDARTPQERK
jgi:hypothetical protein